MAFSVRNVKKFLDDHPKDFPNPRSILAAATRIGGGRRGRVTGPNIERLLGDYSSKHFFEEVADDEIHLKILGEDLFGKRVRLNPYQD